MYAQISEQLMTEKNKCQKKRKKAQEDKEVMDVIWLQKYQSYKYNVEINH